MEQRELLERIYEEVQGLSQRQTVMEQRLQNMENDFRERCKTWQILFGKKCKAWKRNSGKQTGQPRNRRVAALFFF